MAGLTGIASAQDQLSSGPETPAQIWPIDLLIRNRNEPYFLGNDIYSLDGNNQIREQVVQPGVTATYIVEVQNDSPRTDKIRLQATSALPGWTVNFFDAVEGGQDVTDAITSPTGWLAPTLGPGVSYGLRIVVTPTDNFRHGIRSGRLQPVALTATSVNDLHATDTVMAVTIVESPVSQPSQTGSPVDLMIRHKFEANFAGEHIYNKDGEGQSRRQAVAYHQAATYVVRVQNQSGTAGRFKLTAPPLVMDDGWTESYWDSVQGGQNITVSITGNGWLTPLLRPQESYELRLQVSPRGEKEFDDFEDQEASRQLSLLLKAQLTENSSTTGAESRLDTVKAETIVGTALLDALIRTAAEAANGTDYIGAEIYNADGARQTKALTLPIGGREVFHVQLRNRSERPDHFRILGQRTARGQSVRYFDKLEGGQDITRRVVADGWVTPEIAPNGSYELRFEVGPDPTSSPEATSEVPPGVSQSTLPAAGTHMTGVYQVRTTRSYPDGKAVSRSYEMLMDAREITAIMRGDNIGPAYVAPDDETREAQVSLSQVQRPNQVLVRATSLMNDNITDTVKAYFR